MAQQDGRRFKKTYSYFRQRPIPTFISGTGTVSIAIDANRYAKTYQSTRYPQFVTNVTGSL